MCSVAVAEQLAACVTKPLKLNEPMSKHTSFHIGGPADVLAQPDNVAELQSLLQEADRGKVSPDRAGHHQCAERS